MIQIASKEEVELLLALFGSRLEPSKKKPRWRTAIAQHSCWSRAKAPRWEPFSCPGALRARRGRRADATMH